MWKVIEACIQGTAHIQVNKPCQDVTRAQTLDNGQIIVLADGAGTAQHSLQGAEIVCDSIINSLAKDFDYYFNLESNQFQYKIIHRIRTRLGIKAKALHADKNDFSSTLLFVSILNDKFIIGHIGDGVIGATKNGETTVISQPERGEFANSTYFTTSRNYHAHFRIYKGFVASFDNFFLMSDGAADCLYDKKRKTFAKAITTFSQWIRDNELIEVNQALQENMSRLFPQQTTDDCSFIMCQQS